MQRDERFLCQLANAVYLDVAYILDSLWRRVEFNVNRYFRYTVSEAPDHGRQISISARPQWQLPRQWLFAIVVVFAAYGPTLDALCSVTGPAGMRAARYALGILCLLAALILLAVFCRRMLGRARRRFWKARVPAQQRLRRATVLTLVVLGTFTVLLPLILLGVSLWSQASAPLCHEVATGRPAVLQALCVVLALGCVRLRGSRAQAGPDRWRTFLELVLLVSLVMLLWGWIAAPAASEALQTPYPHLYAVFALAMTLLAVISPFWARFMFDPVRRSWRETFRQSLRHTEIFPGPRVDPPLSTRRVLTSTATGVYFNLLQLLLLPAFFLLIVPAHWISRTALLGGLTSIVLVSIGNLTSRWRQMLRYVRRWFLTGTPVVVSCAVIALALLRISGVQYVTTVLDAAPFGVIFVWIIMSYALLWWFEYVINEAVAREMLRLLGSEEEAKAGRVPYEPAAGTAVNMPADHRWIAPHGAGSLVALGWCPDKDTHAPLAVFQAFSFLELFRRLTPAASEEPRRELERALQSYFLGLNFALLACLAAFFAYYGHGDRTNTVVPIVTAAAAAPDARHADLRTLLTRQAREGRPALIVATSGGGTRAALFTASTLAGLARLGLANDVILLSGVSGGGVAAAYFYANQAQLLQPYERSAAAWKSYELHMTDPFIGDVLEGALEWRVVSHEPLGVLLKESFERQLFTAAGLQRIGDADHPALILNTTVTGNPEEDSDLLRGRLLPTRRGSCDQRHIPYSIVSGGRLIFTNLGDRSAFPASGARPDRAAPEVGAIADVRFPYVVVQDPQVLLAAAAALNANFPPVFTNARVDVPAEVPDPQCPQRPYYVTDGGATENLGFVSALYALRKALQDLARDGQPLPELHLVLIEASATTYDYVPDRGINAATGGSKERLTGGLTVELLKSITTELGARAGGAPDVHYLAMPLAFRSRGGFGTHWMFPQTITIENPRTARPLRGLSSLVAWSGLQDRRARVQLDREDLIDLWDLLYDPQGRFCALTGQPQDRGASTQVVADWICGRMQRTQLEPDLHISEWQRLVGELRPH
jgi:hypothetical protein